MPNRRLKCTYCKDRFPREQMISAPVGNFCTEDHKVKYAIANRDKGKKVLEKEHRRKKREFYQKDIKTRREAAVYWFNRYIRLRDAGSPCISCGNRNPNIKYDAGHFIPAGSCSALRFDEQNTNLQCSNRCNVHLSGNGSGYRAGIVNKWGQQTLDRLEGPQPIIKITAAWYKSIEDTYKAKCKQIEAEQERAA